MLGEAALEGAGVKLQDSTVLGGCRLATIRKQQGVGQGQVGGSAAWR